MTHLDRIRRNIHRMAYDNPGVIQRAVERLYDREFGNPHARETQLTWLRIAKETTEEDSETHNDK